MLRRPPRSTRTYTLFPTRRSSDLLAGIGKIITGDTETACGYLLDGRTLPITVWFRFKTNLIFPTFSGVAFPADPVHGNSQGRVCFMRNRPKGHQPGGTAFQDIP